MTTHDAADQRTLQDDRAELAADRHEGSPLTQGEGAPLAEDDVPAAKTAPITQSLLGGAPIASVGVEAAPAGGGLTTAEDRPIGD